MPIMTTIAAVAGIGSGLLSGFGQRAAIKSQNEIRKIQAKTQNAFNQAQYEIGVNQALTNHAWDMARIEQLRTVEAQTAVDQLTQGNAIIDSAIKNFELNEAALRDRFIVEEGLRAKATGMEFDYSQQKLRDDVARQTSQAMRGIRSRGLEAERQVSAADRQFQELQGSLLLDQQRDNLNYNIARAAALMEDSASKARYSARQGSGKTAKRLAMESGQRLGKLSTELDIKAKDRQLRMRLQNQFMTGELSKALGQLAIESEDQADAMAYNLKRGDADAALQQAQLQDLTIPTFGLAERQYGRELTALQVKTDSVITQASQPYRQKEYFDPIKPLPGLKPMSLSPTPIQGPSTGSILANSFLKGVSGAMTGYDAATKTFN